MCFLKTHEKAPGIEKHLSETIKLIETCCQQTPKNANLIQTIAKFAKECFRNGPSQYKPIGMEKHNLKISSWMLLERIAATTRTQQFVFEKPHAPPNFSMPARRRTGA